VRRLLLIAVAIFLAGVPGTAAAAELRLRDTGLTATIVRGDGAQRLALAVKTGPVSVLDTRTHAWSTIPTPAGCSFVDIHRATLLWNCAAQPGFPTGLTYEIATGSRATLPALSTSGGADNARYAAIGDRFARMNLEGYHYVDAYAFIERATGRQIYEHARAGQVRDLDDPGLLRTLCAGALEPQFEGAIDLVPGDPAVAGRWTAAASLFEEADSYVTRVQIKRCGTARARTIRVCRTVTCTQPVLDDRIVAWTELRGLPAQSRLVVRWLRSGRVRRTPWQAQSLQPVLVDHRLYAHEAPVPPEPGDGRGRLLRAAL
jgi:hypothetical protein